MKTTTATPQTITAAAVRRALAQCLTLAAVYGAQRTAAALRAARRATIAARIWLRASHEFFAQDGDPIRCSSSAITSPPPLSSYYSALSIRHYIIHLFIISRNY